jgi:hypothetical protein
MVDAAMLRRALGAFMGDERFRKFVRQGVRGGQLRYWQEQEWNRFATAHPEFAVSTKELEAAIRILNLPTPGAVKLLTHVARFGLRWGLAGLLLGALIGGGAGLYPAMCCNALYSGPALTTAQQAWAYIAWFRLGATFVGGLSAVFCGVMGCIRGIVEAKLSALADLDA